MSDLKIYRIKVGNLEANCYVIGGDKEAIIIDPGVSNPDELTTLNKIINERKVKYVLCTHGHIDHIFGADLVTNMYDAKLGIHTKDQNMLLDPDLNISSYFNNKHTVNKADMLLEDANEIQIEDKVIKVIHSPGHSEGSSCFYTDNILFSGDTIFKRGVGRTDLQGGSDKELLLSINKLFTLPDNTIVYSGHDPESFYLGDRKKESEFIL